MSIPDAGEAAPETSPFQSWSLGAAVEPLESTGESAGVEHAPPEGGDPVTLDDVVGWDAEAERSGEYDLLAPRPEPVVGDYAATWEFEEEYLPLAEPEPADELPFVTPTAAAPHEGAATDAVAERLERIARSLREDGLDAMLREHGSDPLGAIVGAYLSGYLEALNGRYDAASPG